MKIKELADQTSLTPYTIRFYEKLDLLDERHLSRDKNGYRNYSEAATGRIHMIKKFQGIGCTLSELKDVLHSVDTNGRNKSEIAGWIEHKIHEIKDKQKEYDKMLETLEKMLNHQRTI